MYLNGTEITDCRDDCVENCAESQYELASDALRLPEKPDRTLIFLKYTDFLHESVTEQYRYRWVSWLVG